MSALRAAETGHLVLSTMHTLNGAETVQRLCDLFGDRAALARQMLAGTLVGVCSQRLVSGLGEGRVLNSEVLVNTSRVRDMIADDAPLKEISKAMGEGEFYGMHTFDQDLLEHVREGRGAREVALATATDPHDLRLMLAAQAVDEPPAPKTTPVPPVPYAASRAPGT
jgi:twitching motility protein PilT